MMLDVPDILYLHHLVCLEEMDDVDLVPEENYDEPWSENFQHYSSVQTSS